jgi:hypothetical protein
MHRYTPPPRGALSIHYCGCADGGTVPYYQGTAEGLVLQAFGPLLATANDVSPRLQRLLESASNLGPPGVAQVRLISFHLALLEAQNIKGIDLPGSFSLPCSRPKISRE